MKNKIVSVVLIVSVAVIIFAIIVIISTMKDEHTEMYDGTLAKTAETDTDEIYLSENAKHISQSVISGYMMRSENYKINIYEIYSNGHYKIIDTLSVNPSTLPEADRLSLAGGIVTDSYTKICSLIEDFSS